MTEAERLILTNQMSIAGALCIILDAVADVTDLRCARGLTRIRLTDAIQATRKFIDDDAMTDQ
jgi:hypothetical protein